MSPCIATNYSDALGPRALTTASESDQRRAYPALSPALGPTGIVVFGSLDLSSDGIGFFLNEKREFSDFLEQRNLSKSFGDAIEIRPKAVNRSDFSEAN